MGEYIRATNIRHTFRTDGSETIRISSSDAQLIEADVDSAGTLTFTMRGRSLQGEQGADSAAWTLVEKLNQLGATWSDPERMPGPEQGVDFVTRSEGDELHIQVTRAFATESVWSELSHRTEVTREIHISDAVTQLWETLERKARRIAPTARGNVVLALDTSIPAVFAPMRLMLDFKKRYASRTQELGFKSVWLVGPTSALTWRIDEPFAADGPIEIGF